MLGARPRVDRWVERGRQARVSEGARYRGLGERYDIRACVDRLEDAYDRLVSADVSHG